MYLYCRWYGKWSGELIKINSAHYHGNIFYRIKYKIITYKINAITKKDRTLKIFNIFKIK